MDSLDAPAIDAIINHHTVRSTAQGGTYRLESTPALRRGAVAYGDRRGCVLFVPKEDNVWEGHIFCLQGYRGSAALALGKRALARLFTDHRASKLVANVPIVLPAARFLCRRLGLRSVEVSGTEERFELEDSQWAA